MSVFRGCDEEDLRYATLALGLGYEYDDEDALLDENQCHFPRRR